MQIEFEDIQLSGHLGVFMPWSVVSCTADIPGMFSLWGYSRPYLAVLINVLTKWDTHVNPKQVRLECIFPYETFSP